MCDRGDVRHRADVNLKPEKEFGQRRSGMASGPSEMETRLRGGKRVCGVSFDNMAGVTRMFKSVARGQECRKSVTRVSQECHKSVKRVS